MGKKEKELVKILTDSGIVRINNMQMPSFTEKTLFGSFKDEVLNVYQQLGGIESEYAFRGKCDIVTEEFVIELDEQLHFNDYRLTTLDSPLYNEIKKFPLENYKEYCKRFRNNCLKAGSFGGKWTNDSCEKMFGPAQSNGDLSGNGSPRWKQRAFYDFVKDISVLVTQIPVVRLSVYDVIDYRGTKYRLSDILENDCIIGEDAVEGLQKLINQRI